MSILGRRMQMASDNNPPVAPEKVTFSGVATSMIAAQSVQGTVATVGLLPVFAVLCESGTEQGSRTTVSSTSSSLSVLSPASAGTYTVRVFDSLMGGVLLGESNSFSVSPSTTLISPAYFVASTGNDSNAGTIGAPFLTFDKARDTIRVGGSTKTVYIRGGTYSLTASFTLNNTDNGTQWLAYPGETPVVDGGSSLVNLWFLDVGSKNITIHGLTFQNAVGCAINLNGYDTATSTSGADSDNIISNCTFQNILVDSSSNNYGAILGTYATRDNIVRNNLFQNCTGPGVAFVAGPNWEINIGNKVVRNKFINMNNAGQTDMGAIYFMDRSHNALTTDPSIIDSNYVENGGIAADTKFIYLDDEMSCVAVTNNIICGTAQYGFQLHGSDHVTIANNIFDLTNISTISGYALALYQDCATYTNYGMSNNTFERNIVYTSGTYGQSYLWRIMDSTNGAIAMATSTNNLYYSTTGTLPNSSYTAGIVDSSPVIANPQFTSAADHDYSFTTTTDIDQIGFAPIDQSFIGPQ